MSDKPARGKQAIRTQVRVAFALMALALFSKDRLAGAAAPAASETQVKAIFIYNFARYVEWPVSAFATSNAPIVIGVLGTDPFGDNLQHDVDGKTVNGRPFVIKHFAADSEWTGCQILFISHSEASRVAAILTKTSLLPILTVGEDDSFAQNGGIVNFVLKNGNVRLEIDLAAARKAGLAISSKLLAVADVVKGKSN